MRPGYSKEDQRKFYSARSPRYRGDDCDHHHASAKETLGERMEEMGSTAPIQGNPSLDPAGEMINVSEMAGFNAGAFSVDHLDGPEQLVMGEVGHEQFLSAPSKTAGGPLDVAHDESCYEHQSCGSDMDWCREL